jgi:predicted nuclease of predicted toxin-antitoxin system
MPRIFICDTNIPPQLARSLRSNGFEAIHVLDIGLEAADDSAVWKYAADRDAIIVTKDTDFVRSDASQPSPRVILVCTGNCSNSWLIARFSAGLSKILSHFDSGAKLVELR